MVTVVIAIYVLLQKQVAEVESDDATSNKRKYYAGGWLSFVGGEYNSSDEEVSLYHCVPTTRLLI